MRNNVNRMKDDRKTRGESSESVVKSDRKCGQLSDTAAKRITEERKVVIMSMKSEIAHHRRDHHQLLRRKTGKLKSARL